MDDSTRSMRNTIVDRDIFPALTNRLLTGTGPGDIRQVRSQVKDPRRVYLPQQAPDIMVL